MAFSRMTDDLNIIAALDDEPNDVGGLSAQELKAKFDDGGKMIQSYINNTLIAELEALGADHAVRYVDGAGKVGYIRLNADNALETSVDGVTYQALTNYGHIIFDGNDIQLPQRSRIKFVGTEVTDEDGVTVVHGMIGIDVHDEYATLAALQAAYPSGDSHAYKVLADNNIYIWSASLSAWKSIGQLTGPTGKSAYESALDGGYTGTEAQFNVGLAQLGAVPRIVTGYYTGNGASDGVSHSQTIALGFTPKYVFVSQVDGAGNLNGTLLGGAATDEKPLVFSGQNAIYIGANGFTVYQKATTSGVSLNRNATVYTFIAIG